MLEPVSLQLGGGGAAILTARVGALHQLGVGVVVGPQVEPHPGPEPGLLVTARQWTLECAATVAPDVEVHLVTVNHGHETASDVTMILLHLI